GPELSHRADRGAHGRACGEAVIDEDDRPVLQLERRSLGTVEGFATLEFGEFLLGDGLDHLLRDLQLVYDRPIPHEHSAAGYGAHRQLFVLGNAQLAHDEHLERDAQRLRDFKGDRDTAARQGEYDDFGATLIGPQELRDSPAGRAAIWETR